LINRKGSAKRLIWRQILRRISCVMTCAGVTSNRRRLILCRQAKPSAPRKNPSAASPARADMAVKVLLRWRNDVYFAYGANTVVRQ
jgi:hypothetical protein